MAKELFRFTDTEETDKQVLEKKKEQQERSEKAKNILSELKKKGFDFEAMPKIDKFLSTRSLYRWFSGTSTPLPSYLDRLETFYDRVLSGDIAIPERG